MSHFLLNVSAGIFKIQSRKPRKLKVSLSLIWGLKGRSSSLFLLKNISWMCYFVTHWIFTNSLTVCKYLVQFSRYFILKFHIEDAMTVTFWMETRPEGRHNCSIQTKWKFFFSITQRIMNIPASNFPGWYYPWVAIKISKLRCYHGNQRNNTVI